ncbi:hypothetical protein MPSEU_000823100 [Mayamaea pseudoterrestris]|nr:hypothetical protein MPSEU_000823100 [Mayamaea pseudoterrestris]
MVQQQFTCHPPLSIYHSLSIADSYTCQLVTNLKLYVMVSKDERIDYCLDKLRESHLPVILEVPVSLISCCVVGCLYSYLYYWKAFRLLANKCHRMPIMTQDRLTTLQFSLEKLEVQVMERPEQNCDDEQLIRRLRSEHSLRRLINQYMTTVAYNRDKVATTKTSLYQMLDRLWPRLLELPMIPSAGEYQFEMSIILPAFRETNQRIASTLQRAYETSSLHAKTDVQVVVVNAGGCSTDLAEYLEHFTGWPASNLKVVVAVAAANDSRSQGRGRALNYGASHAQGRVLFFLHSDTMTPFAWDKQILAQFRESRDDTHDKVHATCFRFGFDSKSCVSSAYFENNDAAIQTSPLYWALLPVKWMVNFRTKFLKLPYGDQGIAMPAVYFTYLGGFPNQCIMEDYELMDYLRLRARCLPEKLVVLDGSCLVSIRRWQRVGTIYMTFANALIVWRYTCRGWHPDDVFDYYYKRPYETMRK